MSPLGRWPECAAWWIVRDGQILSLEGTPDGWEGFPYVLAAGQPRILQVGPIHKPSDGPYDYIAIVTLKLADDGHIIRVGYMPLLCPPQEKLAEGAPPRAPRTREQEIDETCEITSRDELHAFYRRQIVKLTTESKAEGRAFPGYSHQLKWIRQVSPSDFPRR